MTTLADLTRQELDQCPGLWADTVVGFTGIIEHIGREKVDLIIPKYKHKQSFPLSHVTLRDDLPRAWHPDGTPPAGEWEEGFAHDDFDLAPSIEGQTTGQMCEFSYEEWEEAVTVIKSNRFERSGESRRWVGEWEKA